MGQAGRGVVDEVVRTLIAAEGLKAECAAISYRAGFKLAPPGDVLPFHIAPELAEKGAGVRYPVVYVYCDRVKNTLSEKFRSFSGTADVNVEIRVSHDHADQIQDALHFYVEAVTGVLERKRGTWGDGMYYTGGYEVTFAPMKKGGKNYLQTARVKFEVHISAV